MDDITVWQGDCLERMREIEDESVNLIATDPPYFRIQNEMWDRQWDSEDSYLDWLSLICDEWYRILALNGSLYCFASPRMAASVECLIARRFTVINSVVWRKEAGCFALKYGPESFRGFVEMSERIIFAEHKLDRVVAYLRAECEAAGLSPVQLSGLLGFKETGGSVGPRRYLSVSGFAPIPKEKYATLQEKTGRFSLDWADIYRPFAATEDSPHTDVWDYPPVPRRQSGHPCEKPFPLMSHIINVSSRPGDLVLDCFAGSGVTGRACRNLGRRCILIEKDPHWAKAATLWLDRPHAHVPRGKKRDETPLFQAFDVEI